MNSKIISYITCTIVLLICIWPYDLAFSVKEIEPFEGHAYTGKVDSYIPAPLSYIFTYEYPEPRVKIYENGKELKYFTYNRQTIINKGDGFYNVTDFDDLLFSSSGNRDINLNVYTVPVFLRPHIFFYILLAANILQILYLNRKKVKFVIEKSFSVDFLKNFLLMTVSLALSLVIAEFAIRLFIEQKEIVSSDQYHFYDFDKRLGWVNTKNQHGRVINKEFEYDVYNNDYGMRYRNFKKEKDSSKKRVAVLGDSFTWGFGVSVDDRYTEIAEKLLDDNYELLNFAVSGYAPIHYYIMIDDILEKYNPDIVIIGFCLGNDFIDNVQWERYGYYKPYAEEDEKSGIKIEGYPLPRSGEYNHFLIPTFIQDNSRLFSTIKRLFLGKQRTATYGQAGLVEAAQGQDDIYLYNTSNQRKELADKMFSINARLLMGIKEKVVNSGAKLVLLMIPTKCEMGECWVNGSSAKNMVARDALLKTARECSIEIIDPTGDLTLSDFWNLDGHWRASGHRKVARNLAEWLKEH